jgi:DNA-binding winged helix-turn-helix (wHTH) protein
LKRGDGYHRTTKIDSLQEKTIMKTSFFLTDRFYLDEWLVEPELGRLTKGDEVRQLEPKIMQVLVCLAENNGNVVRKEEFLADIWEGINVTQHVLTRTISEIRRVVGDDPQNPSFIQTIPKIGYRMIAKISEPTYQGPPSHTRENALAMPSMQPRLNPVVMYFIGGAVTVVVALATLLMIFMNMHGGGHIPN